jgi:large subunit ribosomal protein L5
MTTTKHTPHAAKTVPEFAKTLGITNVYAVPRVTKIVVNSGVGRATREPKALEAVQDTLTKITGQKSVVRSAKKSVAAFKIREGMPIGASVTLRGNRMRDFLTKLVSVTLPRVRDFRGIDPKAVGPGTVTIGFPEHLVFPEVGSDVTGIHGLEVTVVTTAKDRAATYAFLKSLGFPLQTRNF